MRTLFEDCSHLGKVGVLLWDIETCVLTFFVGSRGWGVIAMLGLDKGVGGSPATSEIYVYPRPG